MLLVSASRSSMGQLELPRSALSLADTAGRCTGSHTVLAGTKPGLQFETARSTLQSIAATEPDFSVPTPAAQGKQSVPPSSGWYVLSGHSTHACSTECRGTSEPSGAPNCPVGHGVQTVLPAAILKVFAEQAVHVVSVVVVPLDPEEFRSPGVQNGGGELLWQPKLCGEPRGTLPCA